VIGMLFDVYADYDYIRLPSLDTTHCGQSLVVESRAIEDVVWRTKDALWRDIYQSLDDCSQQFAVKITAISISKLDTIDNMEGT
jgi:hypothetical protein